MVGTLIADIKQAKLSDTVVLKIVVKIQLCQDDAYDMAEKSLPENIVTEHEKMFMAEGIKIKGLIAVNKG